MDGAQLTIDVISRGRFEQIAGTTPSCNLFHFSQVKRIQILVFKKTTQQYERNEGNRKTDSD